MVVLQMERRRRRRPDLLVRWRMVWVVVRIHVYSRRSNREERRKEMVVMTRATAMFVR